MGYRFSFENLDLWNDAKQFTVNIYEITKSFPRNEEFGLSSQIRRAAVSICSNLAEGTARKSTKEQSHFSQIAYASLTECLCQLIIASELGYIHKIELTSLRGEVEKISNKINALRKYQQSKSFNFK